MTLSRRPSRGRTPGGSALATTAATAALALVTLTACSATEAASSASTASSGGASGAATSAADGAAAEDTSSAAATSGAGDPSGDGAESDPTVEQPVQTDPSPSSATAVLTSAQYDAASGDVQASGFVQGLLETGGTCRLTALSADGEEVRGDAGEAETGPSTTDCGPLSVALPGAAAGTWTVSFTYESASTTLTSATTEVQVP